MKDAALMARADDPELRRIWRQRIIDHDGNEPGRRHRALARPDRCLGLDRDYVASGQGLLPAPASPSMPMSASWPSAPCWRRSPPPHRALRPSDHQRPGGGDAGQLRFISRDALAYFDQAPDPGARDADFALDYVKREARRPDQQQA